LDQHEVAVSRGLLSELRRNLIRKMGAPEQLADEIVSSLESRATVVTPAPVDTSVCRDPDDLKILGTAAAFGADYLVTGHQDLLIIEQFSGFQIVLPSFFAHVVGQKIPAENS